MGILQVEKGANAALVPYLISQDLISLWGRVTAPVWYIIKELQENDPGKHCNEGSIVHAQLLQSCPTLWDPMDCGSPGSSVHGILQARILEWVTMSSSRGSPQARDQTHVSCTSRSWIVYQLSHLGSLRSLYALTISTLWVVISSPLMGNTSQTFSQSQCYIFYSGWVKSVLFENK